MKNAVHFIFGLYLAIEVTRALNKAQAWTYFEIIGLMLLLFWVTMWSLRLYLYLKKKKGP